MVAVPYDGRADAKKDGGKHERKPESDPFLSINHSDLTNQSSDIDEQVEVMVYPALGDGRIKDDPFSGRQLADNHLRQMQLFSDERRNIAFEATSTDTHYNETNDEGC